MYHVSEFCEQIQHNMIKNEETWSVDANYMNKQTQINEKIRSTLVDWLIQTHYNFKLLPESLFLTMNIVDRYASKNQIRRDEV